MEKWTRRRFFASTLAGSLVASTGKLFGAAAPSAGSDMPQEATRAGKGTRPLIISAHNGLKHLDDGMRVLRNGGDPLDAVLAVVPKVEDDPNDHTVGYGGLPNEDGVVQLDACVMHGPTGRSGAVGAIERIKNPALVAKAVMQKTNHTFLVGPGATKFAEDMGFQPMSLLTEDSRLAWLAWKGSSSKDWRPGLDSPEWNKTLAVLLDAPEKQELRAWIEDVVKHPPTGTINCLAVNERGDISGTTTTSGLAWKISGRVGDSPIIGAGCFVDNEVGAAGSTGKGEENIKISGGHTIVEMMRQGKSPEEACLEALSRIAHNYGNDKKKLATFHIFFYALNKDGQHGAASLWRNHYEEPQHSVYAVHDGSQARLTECKPFFDEVNT